MSRPRRTVHSCYGNGCTEADPSRFPSDASRPNGKSGYCYRCANKRSKRFQKRKKAAAMQTDICPICERSLPVGEFGICRSRASGRNLYCRNCIRAKVSVHRESVRAKKMAQKEAREKQQLELPILPRITATERVLTAVERGARTPEAIHQATRLNYDFLGDLLAEMVWEKKVLRIARLSDDGREFHVAA